MAKPSKKNALKRNWLLIFYEFHYPFSPRVWHLWQQKINIAVGRRVRTRARERAFSLWTLCIEKCLFCNACLSLYVYWKEKSADFCDFFTLWDHIDPYTYRDTKKNSPCLAFHFYFHGESHSNIPNITPNHCRFLLSSWFLVAVSYKLGLHPFQNIRYLIISDQGNWLLSKHTENFRKTNLSSRLGLSRQNNSYSVDKGYVPRKFLARINNNHYLCHQNYQ